MEVYWFVWDWVIRFIHVRRRRTYESILILFMDIPSVSWSRFPFNHIFGLAGSDACKIPIALDLSRKCGKE